MNRGLQPVAGVKSVDLPSGPSPSTAGQVQLSTGAGTAAWGALPSSKFRNDIQAYNLSGSSMRKWFYAYAKARNGEGRATISLIGDSVTRGTGSSSPQYANSWPARAKTLIEARTGVVTGTGFVRPTADTGEDRFALSGTWFSRGQGAGFANDDLTNNTGGTLTIGPITCDRIRVYFLKYSGGGTATTTLDGSAAATIATNNASFTAAFQDFTASAGSHTLVVTAPTGSDFVLLGWSASQNGLLTGVRINNYAIGGKKASDASSNTSGTLDAAGQMGAAMWNLEPPDLTVLSFGLNEMNTSGASDPIGNGHKAALQNLITAAKSKGSCLLMAPPPPSTSVGGRYYSRYLATWYDLADTNDIGLLDLSQRWPDDATAQTAGLKADGQHPNSRGYWDLGTYVSTALLATAIV